MNAAHKDYLRDAIINFKEWLPREDLEIGGLYLCKARNFRYGIWDGKVFKYERTKWGQQFIDKERHWDEGPPFGTAKPFLLVGRGGFNYRTGEDV